MSGSNMSYLDFRNVKELEEYARQNMPDDVKDYIFSATGDHVTLRNNLSAFQRYLLRPRTLCDCSGNLDTFTTLLGQKVNSPISITNAGYHKIVHPDGETATARASASAGICMALSTFSTCSLEEVAQQEPNLLKWFQLTFNPDRRVSEQLIRRAEKAGFKAIIFAGDPSVVGSSCPFKLPPHLSIPNFPEYKGENNVASHLRANAAMKVTWEDACWLRSITKLPIILKGVMTVEDAELAVHHGIDAVWLSNWGGRRGDNLPSTLDVLPDIVRAVDGRVEVYLDSGVRSGNDAFKAIALGARAVFLGRPVYWALNAGGEEGVAKLLKVLDDEFKSAMRLTGSRKIADIKSSMIIRQSVL